MQREDFLKVYIEYTTGFVNVDLKRKSIIQISKISHPKLKNELLGLLLECFNNNLDFLNISVAYDRDVVFNQATVIIPFEGVLSSTQLNNLRAFICKKEDNFFTNYYISENKIFICRRLSWLPIFLTKY